MPSHAVVVRIAEPSKCMIDAALTTEAGPGGLRGAALRFRVAIYRLGPVAALGGQAAYMGPGRERRRSRRGPAVARRGGLTSCLH
jgi:hypothetical protein